MTGNFEQFRTLYRNFFSDFSVHFRNISNSDGYLFVHAGCCIKINMYLYIITGCSIVQSELTQNTEIIIIKFIMTDHKQFIGPIPNKDMKTIILGISQLRICYGAREETYSLFYSRPIESLEWLGDLPANKKNEKIRNKIRRKKITSKIINKIEN